MSYLQLFPLVVVVLWCCFQWLVNFLIFMSWGREIGFDVLIFLNLDLSFMVLIYNNNYFISIYSSYSFKSIISANFFLELSRTVLSLFYYSTISMVYASYFLMFKRRVWANPIPSWSDNVGFLKSWITIVTNIFDVFSLLWIF